MTRTEHETLMLALFAALVCCNDPTLPARDQPQARGASAQLKSPAEAASTQAARPNPTPPSPCRIIALSGEVDTDGGQRLARGDALDGGTWLTLRGPAEVTVKHAASGREYRLRGPGEALACREGREEVLLSSGFFESAPGPGARPGALVLVASPLGHLTYGDGQLRALVTGQKTEIHALSGSGWVEPAEGTPKVVQPGGGPVQLKPEAWTAVDRSLDRCRRLAREAAESAEKLLNDPEARVKLGAKARDQLHRRQMAHAACAVAAAAARGIADRGERGRVADAITTADGLWRRIPAKK